MTGEYDTTEQITTEDFNINVNTYGQISIQKLLLPNDDGETFEFVEIAQKPDIDEENDELIEGSEIKIAVNFTHDTDTQEPIDNISDNEINTSGDSDNIATVQTDKQQPEFLDNNITGEQTIENSFSEASGKKAVSDVRIWLGSDTRSGEKIYWEFGNKSLNNRHLLINGNSGCGKTYCIQGLLMSAARQGVSSVVFDYTGGFTNSQLDSTFKGIMGNKIVQRIIRKDKIPVNPFVKHEIQIDDDLTIPEEDVDIASKISEIFTTVYSLGEQQKSAVYSAVLNGLRTYDDKMSFQIMAQELDNIGSSYAKSVISKIQPFTDINPFVRDDNFNWNDIRESDGIVYVVQLVGYDRETQVLLTEILLWDIWNFCVKTGNEQKPFILVMDEAQNLDHGEKSPSAKILTEGRKFGISGWYATQFMKPQLSDDEIQRLQQSGQKLYFCPPDDGVDTVAKNLDTSPQGKKDWAARLKKLKKGECVTCGSMVKSGKWTMYPSKVIKVPSMQERLDDE